MVDIVHPAVAQYLAKLEPVRDPVFREMEERAQDERFPIVGPLVGGLLAVLAQAIRARWIFEMGSGFGYSGLWLASGLPENGRIILTDPSGVRAKQAKDFFCRAGQDQKLEFRIGDGVDLLRRTTTSFDLIFIDIEKARYPLAFHAALPKLKAGGLLIADNVLWFGQVTEPRPDADTRGILEFTHLMTSSPDLSSTILPLRDGVSVSIKKR